jgi:prepilin peptidase CpaA
MTAVASIILLIFPVAMAFAAANDLLTMKIPNRVSLLIAGSFVPVAALTSMPLETFGLNLAVGFGVLVVAFGLFAAKLLGGGDAKLIAAGALWMGPSHAVEYIAYVTIFGGLLALIILAYRNFVPGVVGLPEWARRLHTPGGPIPYGIAIAAAALVLFPATDVFRSVVV